MIDPNLNEENGIQRRSKQEKSSKMKGFLMTLSAGVIGSVLTLSITPYLDFYQPTNPPMEEAVSANVQGATTTTLPVQTVSTAPTSIADTIEQASEAIVGIVNLQQQQTRYRTLNETVESGTGSGVIFKKTDEAAYIVTNNHVIEGASELEVSLYDGEKVPAELIGTDPLTDLAVLKIDSSYVSTVLEFGDSSILRAGDQVLAIGNPLGIELSRTVTQGIVSGVERTIPVTTSAGEWDMDVIQTDAAINPGNSGGALINTEGQVIGINSLKISTSGVEGLGFAIPSNEVIPIIEEIMESGKVVRPYVGVGLASLEEVPQHYLQQLPTNINQGALVTTIDPNSAAATAGLQVEDILVAVEEYEITDSSDLRKYLYTEFQVGEKVEIKFYRQGELQSTELTLGSNP
ncbi:S1C family serine protease [Alkalihalobacillus sp. BA299]|uniref:S1C family serine protease n=1 Tax=Alkalihalobacillus sp. BA299 TaxID=2815938 RepID=UPI001ADC5FA8|nr:trypsin-like peptidase domain-containing protein [Alkalihalobacillus sp. BA299]